MGKRKKNLSISFDYELGFQEIIPSTQHAYSKDKFDPAINKTETIALDHFKKVVNKDISKKLEGSKQFPTKNAVFVVIVQFFESSREYGLRDIDNMAKTILDVLVGSFFFDDSQVRTLLVSKKLKHNQIKENYAYIAIKELKSDRDIKIASHIGIEKGVHYYNNIQKNKERTNH